MQQCVALCVLIVACAVPSLSMRMSPLEKTDETLALMMMEGNRASPNIPTLAGNLGLTELVNLVVKADLATALSGKGPFTVFGPTNEAFKALPPAIKRFIKTKANLAAVLTYHVISASVPSSALKDELLATSLSGKKIRVNLYPKGQSSFKVATVQCAPIDLSKVDQMASNGLIHVLNSVMIPPDGTISQSVSALNGFKTLTTALKAAGLVDVLNGPGPFTVFAPTDEAFAKLPPGVLDNLLKNQTALQAVLKYHVVSGTYCSSGLTSGPVPTLNSKPVQIDVSSAGVTVNKIKVIAADVSVTNGVAHVIEGVLLPPGFM